MSQPETVKIKPSHPSQGAFVLINKSDFNPEMHELFEDEPEGAKKASVAELREALTAKGVAIPEGAKKADLQALLDAQPQ